MPLRSTSLSRFFIFSLLIQAVVMCFLSCSEGAHKKSIGIQYPGIICDSAVDNYFGTNLTDPFRCLENTEAPAVQKWIGEEKKLCDSILAQIPYRDSLKKNLEEMIYSSNERGGFPRVIDKKLFYNRIYMKEGMEKLFYRDSLNAPEIEIFSTASIKGTDHSYSIDYWEPSSDGKYLAFGMSSNGNEMASIHIIDMDKKQLLPEIIERANYGTPFWIPGKSCFFYSQLKEIKTEEDKNSVFEDSKIKLHWIGKDPKTDKEIFSDNLNNKFHLDKIDFPTVFTFPGSDKVIAFTVKGATPYMALYSASLDDLLSGKTEWKKLVDEDEKTTCFTLYQHQLYVLNFKNNPNGSLLKMDLDHPEKEPVSIVEGNNDVLEDISQTESGIYLKKLKNGIASVVNIDPKTGTLENIKLPFDGYCYIKPYFEVNNTCFNSPYFFFGMESYNKEVSVYCYDPQTKMTVQTNLRPHGKYGNIDDILVKETEVPSADGTLVPISIIYSKNTVLDGTSPTILEGYGAYGSSMNASFSLTNLTWIRMGGIYAVAHIRGGGEKGDSWYKGGYKSTKSNSWKDFIACAEYLIQNNYASAATLAAKGTSAGGIAAGRAVTERPELFKAALLDVSVLNAVRLEKTNNTLNVSEFGSANDSAGFYHLLEMDVYHHIKPGVNYPALMITAGLNDARVELWQPAKAVARFQKVATAESNIVLFKISNAGHSGDDDKVKMDTDYFSFLFWQLGNPKFRRSN